MNQSDFSLKRDILKHLDFSKNREWLITNGAGAYGSGTISGILTRKYHGLLIVPNNGIYSQRKLLVSKFEEIIEYKNKTYYLSANEWLNSSIEPKGYAYLYEFKLEGITPVWTYKIDNCFLQKRIWMNDNENTTYTSYYLAQAEEPINIQVNCFANYRDHHAITKELIDYPVESLEYGCRVDAEIPFYILSQNANKFEIDKIWHKNYKLSLEEKRGYDFIDNNCQIIKFSQILLPSKLFTVVATTNENTSLNGIEAYSKKIDSQIEILDKHWTNSLIGHSWLKQLALAGNQFIVKRPLKGKSIIAGYPWFNDWSRDTLISLSGLCDIETTKEILLTYIEFINNGLLPTQPQEPFIYDNADSVLWYFIALKNYLDESKDIDFLRGLFIDLIKIIDWYLQGTEYNIKVDSKDCLISASADGFALTWMDAKCKEKVFTPRQGKPVEINALWYNALLFMAEWSNTLELTKQEEYYKELAKKVRISFQKFWNTDLNCLYDVIDTPSGWADPSIRPNQIFAISLPYSPITQIQQESILKVCESHLLTPFGLRTLSFKDPEYIGNYNQNTLYGRDASYHQGTVWTWLLGPFIIAHYKVFQNKNKALQFFNNFPQILQKYCIGTIGEIFDGNMPFNPEGCISQAWSVAEILRAYKFIFSEQIDLK